MSGKIRILQLEKMFDNAQIKLITAQKEVAVVESLKKLEEKK